MTEVKEKDLLQDEGLKKIAKMYRDGTESTKHFLVSATEMLYASQVSADEEKAG